MVSIENIKASDGSANASVATVQSSRSSGASTLIVDTVAGINPDGFAGSMGTPHTFTDPVTSEEMTVISEATAVDFTGHVDGSNLEIDAIAPGYVDNGSEVGDIVIIKPTTQWGDNLAAVLETSLDDDGSLKDDIVTAPKLSGIDKSNLTTDSNPYKFRAYRNSAQNTGNGAYAVLACDTEVYDTNSNLSSGVYTAPVTGYYWLYGQSNINTPSTNRDIQIGIFVNGTKHTEGTLVKALAASNAAVTVSGLIPLTAGDTADVRIYGEVTLAINPGGSSVNYFGGFLVSRT